MAIVIPRGTEYTIGYSHFHSVDGVVTPFPLTDCTLYFTVKPVKYDSDTADTTAAITRTETTFTDAANGVHTITLTEAETQLDPDAEYYGDIKVQEPGRVGAIRTFESAFKVTGSPTNRNI